MYAASSLIWIKLQHGAHRSTTLLPQWIYSVLPPLYSRTPSIQTKELVKSNKKWAPYTPTARGASESYITLEDHFASEGQFGACWGPRWYHGLFQSRGLIVNVKNNLLQAWPVTTYIQMGTPPIWWWQTYHTCDGGNQNIQVYPTWLSVEEATSFKSPGVLFKAPIDQVQV